jgi:hypothetical protein
MAWDSDNNANRLKQSYINDFIDVSGSVILRDTANVIVNGNTNIGGNIYANGRFIMNADLSYNKIMSIGGDVSFNQKLRVAGDVSLNGKILNCSLATNSIPQNAFNGTITVPGPDYTKSSIIYNGNLTVNTDASLNGTSIDIGSQLNVNGNITFSDGTNLNNYVDMFEPLANISAATVYPYNFLRLPPNSGDNGGTFASGAISRDGQIIVFNNGSSQAIMTYDPSNCLLISRDGGTNFTATTVSTTLTNPTYSTVSMSPDGQHMLAYVKASANYTSQELWYSHNSGVNWSKGTITTNLGTNNPLNSNCMSDNGVYMYASAYELYGVLRSTDSGANWSLSTNNLYRPSQSPRHLICSSDGRTVWSGSGNDGTKYISVSDDYGLNFSPKYAFGDLSPSYMKGNADLSIVVMQTWAQNDMYVFRQGIMYSINTSYLGLPTTFQPHFGISGTTDMRYIIVNAYQSGSNNCLYSNDYGYTWNMCVVPYNHVGTTLLLSDTGRFVYRTGSTAVTSGIAIINNIFSNKFIKRSVYTALTVNNNLTAGSYVSSSDYRIKNNVRPLNEMITIDNLRPVKYMQTIINKQQYGLIAHELQQYFPDLVTGIKDGDSLQSINYTGLISILINEIKRLKAELIELDKSIV